eukprot:NODE_5922_length_896_cov_76.642950_g5694_i0.p1 GENE.NODE_5922_length_896_cov_76.642950_g5694_i0~~NODE_5922_length_896_cov_76.642950_g5694_i0.p1  ORF type:complete len:207 (-),score=29.08 NODE_5922_length_896_cov_76.642950_g5694_i0:186-806(-)
MAGKPELKSAFGFYTVAPLGREVRRTETDRDAREKQGLAERNSGFERNEPRLNPLLPTEDSAGWLSNEERLHTDVAGELKSDRDRQLDTRHNVIEHRKAQRLVAEKERWEALYAEEDADVERGRLMAGTSKRNDPSVGYNILDHRLGDGAEAAKHQFSEDASKWRACNRANYLYEKGNNTGNYNILTGEGKPELVKVPPKPVPRPF